MAQSEGGIPSAGVVGLGEIGGGLAGNLLKAGVTLTVCDVRAEATAPYREGAHVADSPRELAGRSDVVLVAGLDKPGDKILPLLFLAATARDLGARKVGLVAPYLSLSLIHI